METPEFDENNNLLIHSPCYEVTKGESKFKLTWFNTRLRVFSQKWEQFNHIEHTLKDGTVVGFRCGQELMDTLFEEGYPCYSMPFVDSETMEWLVTGEMDELDGELATFLFEQ